MHSEGFHGIRVFLLCALKLLTEGIKIDVDYVEDNLSFGICSSLMRDYKQIFSGLISPESVEYVDEYYRKNWNGVPDGIESKYLCENNGLQLLVAMALNDMCI